AKTSAISCEGSMAATVGSGADPRARPTVPVHRNWTTFAPRDPPKAQRVMFTPNSGHGVGVVRDSTARLQIGQSVRVVWRTGPVAVTGATGQVGTALRRRLDQLPNQVRALGRGDDLAAAFGDADAVVHLAGTLQPRKPNTYRSANLDTALATAAALAQSRAQRVVFLSFITAQLDSTNSYLRYKAEAEEALRATATPAVVFRCDHIYGPCDEPGPTASAFVAKSGKVILLGSGSQRLALLYRDDVVEA